MIAGTMVNYVGPRENRHGRYLIVGPCPCMRCFGRTDRVELRRPASSRGLSCVRLDRIEVISNPK